MKTPFPLRREQSCINCFYACGDKEVGVLLSCRRNPPVVFNTGSYTRGCWPFVKGYEWCGEWAPEEVVA